MQVIFVTLLAVQLALTFAFYNPHIRKLRWDQTEKQHVLDVHNIFRAKIARGEIAGQPSASDMTVMSWDDRLEQHAERWSLTCAGDYHDAEQLRQTGPHTWVGQNYAGHSDTTALINYGLNGWFDEHANYDFHNKVCLRDMCGHYTQMVWAQSHLLGCAAAPCDGHNMARFICNYAPGGNINGEFAYSVGPACSKCPANDGYVYCMDNALCATKKQCENTRSGVCKCLVDKQVCKVNGAYDEGNCKCNCKKGWSGLNCQDTCKDNIDYCDQGKKYCAPGNKYHTWMRMVCKYTCDFCRQTSYTDDGAANRNGLTVNTNDIGSLKNNANAKPEYHIDVMQPMNPLPKGKVSSCKNEDTDEYCTSNAHLCATAGNEEFTEVFCCHTCSLNHRRK